MSEKLPMIIAVRAYVMALAKIEADQSKREEKRRVKRKRLKTPSDWSLTFDTETTVDHAQSLRIGTYQVRKAGVREEFGIFYDLHNPKAVSKADVLAIHKWAKKHNYVVRTREEFVREIFYKYGYAYGGRIIGFNLPFDLSRLAVAISTSHGWDMRGAFTLTLLPDKYISNVLVKHLNARSAFIRFAAPPRATDARSMRKKGFRTEAKYGYFQDVKTLAAALLGKSHSLESLAKFLDTPHKKSESGGHGGPITEQYLDYAMNDTQVTWECDVGLQEVYASHGLAETPAHRIYSEASLGKAYLNQMNITPWRKSQPDVPPELIGQIMGTYYGGRSEVRIRREIVRVLYVDFRSMYPTVCTLQGLWPFVTAEGFDWADWTEEARQLLDRVTLTDLQRPDFWKYLPVIVQIEPSDDVLPVRASYETSRTIGLNHLTADDFGLWYTLADCVAAKLFSGRSPKVIRAKKFSPRAAQPNLKKIRIGGDAKFEIDPLSGDFYRDIIVLRGQEQALEKEAKAGGDEASRARHSSRSMMLKLLATSTSYGIFAEQNAQSYDRPRKVIVHGMEDPYQGGPKTIEEPGTHFHPLIATLITGAARLMLAAAELVAASEGIGWAFCDTDSLALVRSDGMTESEFLARCERIIGWFNPLDPYGDGKPLLKMEPENFSLQDDKRHEPLYALAISAKRYVLFNIGQDGLPVIRKALAHGLGHLMPPYKDDEAPSSIPAPVFNLAESHLERWHYDLWYRIIRAVQEGHPNQVDLSDILQLDRKARSRYGANTATLRNWFKRFNGRRPFVDQVKSFNFMLTYQVSKEAFHASVATGELDVHEFDGELPTAVAPWDDNPVTAAKRCFDRRTGRPVPEELLMSYREAVSAYHLHPEAKFENGDSFDTGRTRRRHIKAITLEYIGKEANRWEEQFHVGELPEAQIEYGVSKIGRERIVRALRLAVKTIPQTMLATRARISRQELAAILLGGSIPRMSTLRRLVRAVCAIVSEK